MCIDLRLSLIMLVNTLDVWKDVEDAADTNPRNPLSSAEDFGRT